MTKGNDMTTGEKDQLAAVARDAGHAAKDANCFSAMSEKDQTIFNHHGVHVGRDLIRAGMTKENAEKGISALALHTAAQISTLRAYIEEAVPSTEWAS